MQFLFVHNNFPAQFRYIALRLKQSGHHVAAIGAGSAPGLVGVRIQRYKFDVDNIAAVHPFARSFEVECRRGEQVLYAATALAASGFRPDVIVVHSGWGENLPLRSVFHSARIIVYCEFYYRSYGQDVDFDPEFAPLSVDGKTALNIRNANALLALVDADDGLSPTLWQRSTYPKVFQSKISVIHEGVDTSVIRPDSAAAFKLPSGRVLRRGDVVVTYVARNLEPLRGYHVFLRSLPRVLRDNPTADVVIVGGDGVSYGPHPPGSLSWKDTFLEEIRGSIDESRVSFVGVLDYPAFLSLLQISSVHVYLSYPFVLSWSLLEAMSAGCTIVGSDTAPVREVLDTSRGILVPFLDSRALADEISGCLRDRTKADRLGKAARAFVEGSFDIERVTLPSLERFLLAHGH